MIINFEKNSIMKFIADYRDYCNNLVDEWLNQNFSAKKSNDPFLSSYSYPHIKGKNRLCLPIFTESMPEPYYGKIYDNSVTILNLHPSNNENDAGYLSRPVMNLIINHILGQYSNYAEAFPPLMKNHLYITAKKWWQRIDFSLKKLSNFPEVEQQPFVVEICPWHSDSWGYHEKKLLLKYNYLDTIIYKRSITPFVIGIIHSKLKVGIALSNLALEIIQKLLPTKTIRVWSKDESHGISWPNVSKTYDSVKITYLKVQIDNDWSNGFDIKTKQLKYIKILGISTLMGEIPKDEFWKKNGYIDQVLKYVLRY